MKNLNLTGILFLVLMVIPFKSNAQQSNSEIIKSYLTKINIDSIDKSPKKYRMTAIYTNRDLYGKFMDKTKIEGDYTSGLENGNVKWNNVHISNSKSLTGSFNVKSPQNYMENFKYIPSSDMLETKNFPNFPPTPNGVFSKNLVWDMMGIEEFAWKHLDSLKLNKIYNIPGLNNEFEMADIGTYSHSKVMLCWTGISQIDNELYAVIEFDAIDNIVNISMDVVKTRGTEQYWGSVWVSLKTREIGQAVMYSGSAQEIEITGMENKFKIKTIRELWVNKIK